jgi:ABC-type sugar transport system substrate-binding protein
MHGLRRASLCALVAALAAAGAAYGANGSKSKSCATYAPKEVAAANKGRNVYPVFRVPKCLPKNLTVGFIDADLSYPYFNTWNKGMLAAAKFYGVKFVEGDMTGFKWERTVPIFNQLAVQHPAVVGSITTAGEPLKKAAAQAKVKLLALDLPIPGVPFLGIPNPKAGFMAGKALGKAVADRLNGAWKGKDVYYLGLTNPTCDPCNQRTIAGLQGVRQFVQIDDSKAFPKWDSTVGSPGDNGFAPDRDFLTAHPNAVVVAVGLNDEVGQGLYLAAKAAGREKDVMLATCGGDSVGVKMLKENAGGMMVAAVDFNPYGEGWNWVEGAIALSQGKTYRKYDVNRIFTPQNVDKAPPA